MKDESSENTWVRNLVSMTLAGQTYNNNFKTQDLTWMGSFNFEGSIPKEVKDNVAAGNYFILKNIQ